MVGWKMKNTSYSQGGAADESSNELDGKLLLESYRLYMERLNSEISVHWSRVNIVVTGLIAAIGGYGYLLWNSIESLNKNNSEVTVSNASAYPVRVSLLLALASFAALTINIAAIRILRVGKRWQEVCEGRLMAIESLLYEPHLSNTNKQPESIYLHSSIKKQAENAVFKPSLNTSYASLLVTFACLLAGLCIGHVVGAVLAMCKIGACSSTLYYLISAIAMIGVALLIICAIINLYNELCVRIREQQRCARNRERVNVIVAEEIVRSVSGGKKDAETATTQNNADATKNLLWTLLGLLCSAMVLRACSSKDVKQ